MAYGLITIGQVSSITGIKPDTLYRAISSRRIEATIINGQKYIDFEEAMPKFCNDSRHFDWNGKNVVRSIVHPWSKEAQPEETKQLENPKPGSLLQRRKPEQKEENNTSHLVYKNSVNSEEIRDAKQAREQEAIYKAKKLKLEYERESGLLIPVSEIEKKWQDIASLLQQKILSVPDRIAPELTGIILQSIEENKNFDTEHYIRNILKAELIYSLSDIAESLTNKEYQEAPSPIQIDKAKIDDKLEYDK